MLKIEQCYDLMREHGMPENIVRHSQAVKKVAERIADKMVEQGFQVDKQLVVTSALLHDIAKYPCITGELKGSHADQGARILEQKGHPKIGEVVRKHHVKYLDELENWEEKIVHYADRRVKGDKIVSAEERTQDIIERYGTTQEKIIFFKKSHQEIKRIEEQISKAIKQNANQLF